MQTWINDKCDRKQWPSGPWEVEPDKAQWKDEKTGLDCLAVRHPTSGHWCGYVGLPPGHRFHGKSYDAMYSDDCSPSVHGGLTFAEECQEADAPCRGVCHVAAPGEPEKVWWLGFDCAHCDDASPSDFMRARDEPRYPWSPVRGEYRKFDYVRSECARLAEQLAA